LRREHLWYSSPPWETGGCLR